jgi:hypothetical protein
VVELLPSKHEALSQTQVPQEKKKGQRTKRDIRNRITDQEYKMITSCVYVIKSNN